MPTAISPWILDFSGSPGSGKSALSRALAAKLAGTVPITQIPFELAHQSSPVSRVLRKLRFALRGLMPAPSSLRDEKAAPAPDFAGHRFADAFNLRYVKAMMEWLAARPGLHLLDQGAVQAWWSAGFSKAPFPDQAALQWCEALQLGEARVLLILVDVTPEVAAQRREGRPGRQSRMEKLDQAGDAPEQNAERASAGARNLAHTWAERRPRQIWTVRINNDRDGLDVAADAIILRLAELDPLLELHPEASSAPPTGAP